MGKGIWICTRCHELGVPELVDQSCPVCSALDAMVPANSRRGRDLQESLGVIAPRGTPSVAREIGRSASPLWTALTRAMKWTGITIATLAVVGLAARILFPADSGTSDANRRSAVRNKPKPRQPRVDRSSDSIPIEVKLAVLDGHVNFGNKMADDDGEVARLRFKYLLDTLSKKSGATRTEIADQTFVGRRILREQYGKKATLAELMEGVLTSYGTTDGDFAKYSEMLSLLVSLYGQQ